MHVEERRRWFFVVSIDFDALSPHQIGVAAFSQTFFPGDHQCHASSREAGDDTFASWICQKREFDHQKAPAPTDRLQRWQPPAVPQNQSPSLLYVRV